MQMPFVSGGYASPDVWDLLKMIQAGQAAGAGQNVPAANGSQAASPSDASQTDASQTPAPTPSGDAASQFATQTLASLLNYQQSAPTASYLATQLIDQLGSNGQISLTQIENALGATSNSQIAGLTQAFNQIDTNGDGEISQSELTAAISKEQQDQQASGASGAHHHHHHFGGGEQVTSTQMAQDIIGQLSGGGGSISLSSIDSALGLSTSGSTTGASSTTSTSGSGSSSTTATTSTASASSLSPLASSLPNIAQDLAKLDTNGDGQISVSELATAIQAFRQSMEASWSQQWSNTQAAVSTSV